MRFLSLSQLREASSSILGYLAVFLLLISVSGCVSGNYIPPTAEAGDDDAATSGVAGAQDEDEEDEDGG